MRKYILVVLVLCPVLVMGQSWEKLLERTTFQLAEDNNGGTIFQIYGLTNLISMDKFGNEIILSSQLPSTYNAELLRTKENSFLLKQLMETHEYKLFKINSQGELVWSKPDTIPFPAFEHEDGLFAKNLHSVNKYDTDLNLLWSKNYFFSVSSLSKSSGSILVTGSLSTTTDSTILAEINSAGDTVWTKKLYTKDIGILSRLHKNSDNTFFLATNNGLIVKLNEDKEILWRKSQNTLYLSFVKDGYFTFLQPDYPYNVTMSKFNLNGDSLWSTTIQGYWIEDIQTHFEENAITIACSTTTEQKYGVSFTRIQGDNLLKKKAISGKLFLDPNNNCIQESGEKGVAGIGVKAEPGPMYALADTSGSYSFHVDSLIEYTITPFTKLPRLHFYNCETSRTAYFAEGSKNDSTGLNFSVKAEQCPSLDISVWNHIYNKCFTGTHTIKLVNEGLTAAENVQVQIAFPEGIIPMSANMDYMLMDNRYTFNFTFLAPGEQKLIVFNDSVDCSAPTGLRVSGLATVTTTSTCALPGELNDSVIFAGTLRGSYDPNDKHVFPHTINYQDYLSGYRKLDYRINFQNTGDAPARKVVVVDTLPTGLVFEGFTDLKTSHACTPQIISSDPVIVTWNFENINLPAKSLDEAGSIGYITFSISLAEALPNQTSIENRTAIYFDLNDPIITEPAVVTISDQAETETFQVVTSLSSGKAVFGEVIFRPNPVEQTSTIIIPEAVTSPCTLSLFDAQGKSVSKTIIHEPEHTFHRGNLPAGIYFYQLSNQSNLFSGAIIIR